VEIRASRIIQGHDFAINNRIRWKFTQGFSNGWKSLVEVFAIP